MIGLTWLACATPDPPPLATPALPTPTDLDGDGFEAPDDCDDDDPDVYPGAPEIWYDGIDSDCDGADDFDQDGDGALPPSAGGGDCDDTDPTVLPLPGWETIDACSCGNGVLEAGETCDGPSGPRYTCDADCSGPCGDGVPSEDACLVRVHETNVTGDVHTFFDVDDDGTLDLIVQDYDAGTLGFHPIAPDGSIGPLDPVWHPPLQAYAGVADVDGNGAPDVLTYDAVTHDRVRILYGPDFVQEQTLATPGGRVVVDDFDGNGLPDVLVLHEQGIFDPSTESRIHLQTVLGTFDDAGGAEFEGHPTDGRFQIADRDGNGRAEVVFHVTGFSDQDLVHIELVGNDLIATTLTDGWVGVNGLRDADLNNDGCDETVLLASPWLWFFPCGQPPTQGLPQPIVMPSFTGTMVEAGDLTGSGLASVLVRGNPQYRVLHRPDTSQPFTNWPLAPAYPLLRADRLIDVDGDGRTEIFGWDPISGNVELHRWDP